MLARALQPITATAPSNYTDECQNTLNARKGITTRSGVAQLVSGGKSPVRIHLMLARALQPLSLADSIQDGGTESQNTLNARKGITTIDSPEKSTKGGAFSSEYT